MGQYIYIFQREILVPILFLSLYYLMLDFEHTLQGIQVIVIYILLFIEKFTYNYMDNAKVTNQCS